MGRRRAPSGEVSVSGREECTCYPTMNNRQGHLPSRYNKPTHKNTLTISNAIPHVVRYVVRNEAAVPVNPASTIVKNS